MPLEFPLKNGLQSRDWKSISLVNLRFSTLLLVLTACAWDKIERSIVGLVFVLSDLCQPRCSALLANLVTCCLPLVDAVPTFFRVSPDHNIDWGLTHAARCHVWSVNLLLTPDAALRTFLIARLLPHRADVLQDEAALVTLELVNH